MSTKLEKRTLSEPGATCSDRSTSIRSCYNADPKANTWHGINMVALLARAEKDKIALERRNGLPGAGPNHSGCSGPKGRRIH